MKENKYDDPAFFEQYGKMSRSLHGLEAAGEWHVLRQMLPDLHKKDVLDLGCGYGWHCRYAIEKGAQSVTGIDISEKMLETAKRINYLPGINYERMALEDAMYPPEAFDVVVSSLTLHYIQSWEPLVSNIYQWLKPSGHLVFSVEHPVFTAAGKQDWIYDEFGSRLHWPVDHYFMAGKRDTVFLGERVMKYHRTLTTYLNTLLRQGFGISEVQEPQPSPEMLAQIPEMQDELRRPMMLMVSAEKSRISNFS